MDRAPSSPIAAIHAPTMINPGPTGSIQPMAVIAKPVTIVMRPTLISTVFAYPVARGP